MSHCLFGCYYQFDDSFSLSRCFSSHDPFKDSKRYVFGYHSQDLYSTLRFYLGSDDSLNSYFALIKRMVSLSQYLLEGT